MDGIDLYKRETPRWILYPQDTLVWAGIGGEVELSISELSRVLKRADKILMGIENAKGK